MCGDSPNTADSFTELDVNKDKLSAWVSMYDFALKDFEIQYVPKLTPMPNNFLTPLYNYMKLCIFIELCVYINSPNS